MPRRLSRAPDTLQAIPAELTESDLQFAQENAELHGAIDVLLESAEFARCQAAAADMERALTRNKGLAKDRTVYHPRPFAVSVRVHWRLPAWFSLPE